MAAPIIKIAIAAAIAGVVVFLTTVAPRATAPEGALPQASAKGSRLPLALKGATCSEHGWPDYEPRCQFDFREPANDGQMVRVIAIR